MSETFFDKVNLPSAILHFGAGIITMASAFFLFFQDQILQISFAGVGLLFIISSVMIFFGENKIKRIIVPLSYIVSAVILFISCLYDFKKGYLGLGFTAELLSCLLFLGYAVISIFKEFFNKNNFWLKATEVALCFIQAATIFFILFSYSSFGYKYGSSLEVFYLVLLYLSFEVIAISNSIYANPLKTNKKK